MARLRSWSIRWWLGGLVAGVALPAFLLLAWICVVQVRREQREAKLGALRIARATAARMRDLRSESVALASSLAARPSILDPATCRSAVAVVDFLPRFADVLLFDESGSLVCSGNTLVENQHIALLARKWIQAELKAGRLRAGISVTRTFDHRSILILASSVRGGAGTVVLLELLDIVAHEALIHDAVVTILDRDGTIIARSAAAETWSGRNIRGTPIAELASKSSEGIAEAEGVDGVPKLYGFTRIPDLGWTVYAGVPRSAIVEPVREMFINGAVGSAGIAVIVTVITMLLSRKIGEPIHALVTAARTTEGDAYGRVASAKGPLEIATLATAFNRMVDRREEADERMRIGERKLKALSDRLLTVQEEERTRIARELHDDLGQALTALKMDVIGLMNATVQPPELAPIRDRILSTLDATVMSVQQISSELRPSVLDDLGLVAAIEAEARLFEERSGIECELSVSGDAPTDRDCVTTIYRIVQEALTNVARHSNATRTELRLRGRGDELLLEIRDDGRGVTAEEISDPMSLGLIGIRERADLIGGSVQIEGIASRGTIVSVRIPMARSGRPA